MGHSSFNQRHCHEIEGCLNQHDCNQSLVETSSTDWNNGFLDCRGALGQNLYLQSLALTSATFTSAMTNLIPAMTFVVAICLR